MTAHALLSASGSKRWMACTPSARLEAVLPEPKRKSGAFDFSQEGTTAHQLAEAKLRRHYGQMTAKEYIAEVNAVKETPYYNDEFEQHVDNYVLYVRSQIGEGDTPMFEQRVDFSDWVTEGFGTADVVILSETKVRVIDLKFGKGISVDAKDNPQLRLYALGAWNKYKDKFPNIEEIEYTIHQPRLDSITTDHTTLTKLLDWAEHVVKPKAKKAWAGQGEFVAGDHCQFCRAKAQCRARSDFNNMAAAADFRLPALLTEAELAKVLEKAPEARKWLSDVEAYLLKRAKETGTTPMGYVLGKSSTNRKIQDPEAAAEKLWQFGADIYEPRTLKSVAQLEKLVGKGRLQELLDDLIVRPEGEDKLVKSKATEEFS
jgi:hypothetical protein